jgi:AraC-like DNA-binding protein
MNACSLLAVTDILWQLLESNNHDPAPLFAKAGISRDAIKTAGLRVPFRVVDDLWREASRVIDDPCFGLRASEFWHPSQMHALGYAWLSSHTLREALNRYKRYNRIISPAAEITLEDNDQGLALIVKPTPQIAPRPNRIDAFFTCIMKMCRMNYGKNLNPVRMSLTRKKPSCFHVYQEVFKAPVVFEADQNSLILPSDAVDRRLISDNPQLALIHDKIMIDYLANLEKSDTVNQVKAAIIDRLPSGEIAQQDVAPLVNMSVRSLQRRLKTLGTSFQKLLDLTRRELAQNYIRDMETDLSEIAFMLGFSEHSAFSRAFKRWTGRSPKETRDALRS